MKISGTVIWYNPDKEVMLNIKTYIDYIDKLYIIDNSSENNKELADKLKNKKIEYIPNKKNLGIAKALNMACERAVKDNYKWILTMDQDSAFDKEEAKRYFRIFEYIENKKIGIISPNHILKNDIEIIDKDRIFIKTDNVITSGNLLNLDSWREVGKFNENLFIDEVDSDICFKLIKKDYKISKLNKVKMFHNLGNLEKRKFFFKNISVFNHNYIRKYYIMRNKFYMFSKYKKYRKRYIYYILNDFFKVIFYEKDKVRKLKYMFKGINDFFQNRMGKLTEE